MFASASSDGGGGSSCGILSLVGEVPGRRDKFRETCKKEKTKTDGWLILIVTNHAP